MSRTISNLTDSDVGAIIKIITTWGQDEKLSWENLINAVKQRLNKTWSRQALDRHESISEAFKMKKAKLRAQPLVPEYDNLSPEVRMAMERIAELEFDNERLSKEIMAYQEKFTVWAYNAHAKGMTEFDLSRPLPRVNRGGTRDV